MKKIAVGIIACVIIIILISVFFFYAPTKLDYLCRVDSDCEIKNAGCCGVPRCLNKNVDSETISLNKKIFCTAKDFKNCMVSRFMIPTGCVCEENKCKGVSNRELPD